MRHPEVPLPRASGEVTLCQDTRGALQRESSEDGKSQCEVTHSSSHPHLPKASEFSNRQLFSAGPACCPPWTEMLPPRGCLAASRPSQEPPFQSRRPWARDCPQVGEGPAQGPRATGGSRQFFWNPPDSDLALAEVLAQEPGGWVRGLGSPLVPCAGRPHLTAQPGVPLGRLQCLAPLDVLFGGPRGRPPTVRLM